MKNQPGPSEQLEELADKVIGHMDRLAVTSFESALGEMIDFHRFLIQAYETRDEHGGTVSFAQMGDWRALHEEWIREYRRLFERAIRYIGQENDFIESLVRVPFRLLPQDGRHSAPAVTTSLLDLVNILVHRLEAWLTQRRKYEPGEEGNETTVYHVADSDRVAYEEVVVSLVGAWEDTLRIVGELYRWRRREIEPTEQWKRFAASWPFLQQHLRNSAYLLAVAVWNEDEIATGYYAEMLLRWFDGLQHTLEDDHHLFKTLLTPDLLEKQWNDALVSLAPMVSSPSMDQPSPSGVFSGIVQNVLSDAIAIAAGVILGWFIERRQDTDVAPRIVFRLVSGAVADDDAYRTRRETGFRQFFLQLVRLYSAGERFRQQGYGHWLDRFVATLDSMSERRVVPGRVYRPSTRDEREDLLMPWLTLLLAQMPGEGDGNLGRAVSQLTDREDAFTHGDRTLRGLLDDLHRLRSALTPEQHEYLSRGVTALNAETQIDERSERLASILDGIIKAIEAQRQARLQIRPIDEGKLYAIREQVEQALTSGSGGIEVFESFSITREPSDLPNRECTIGQIEKGYLTQPEMAQEPVNIWEIVAKSVQSFATRFVWAGLSRRPRRLVNVMDEASYLAALTDEARPILRAGLRPVLLVRGWSDPPWIGEWFGWSGERPAGIKVRRKSEVQTNLYIGTVNDIDVYRVTPDEGQSLLFRSDLLTKVRYGLIAKSNVVDVEFIAGHGEQPGSLKFRFSQDTEWREDEIVVFQYPVVQKAEID